MAIVVSLPRAVGSGRKLSITQTAVTGTAAVATGLAAIDTGGAIACAAQTATTATQDQASISSVSAGTVNVVNALLTYSGPTIALSAAAHSVNVWATGH